MVMETLQIRLSKEMLLEVDKLLETGMYSSRADVIRDGVRRLVGQHSLQDIIGILPDTGDSVTEVRAIRKKLSKEIKSFEDLDKLNELVDNINRRRNKNNT